MPTPAVIQYPTRSAPAVRGRRGRVTPGRWATIEIVLTPAEGATVYRTEQVINISMMIPPERPPELPGLTGVSDTVSHQYFLERVSEGVKIGMVRGGTIDAVGGFGYPETLTPIWAWFTDPGNSGYIALFEDI